MIASPVLMGLVLLIDPSAKSVEWSGGVAVELRGGYAPPVANLQSEPALRITVAPTAVMLYRDRPRNRELWVEYTPSAYYRLSEQTLANSQLRRPLVFNQLRARYLGDFNRRVSWSSVVGGSIGELDYSLQAAQLGTNPTVGADGSTDNPVDGGSQGQLGDQLVIRTGDLSGAFGITVRPHPLHSVTVQPSVTVRQLLGSQPSGAGFNYDQKSGDLSLTYGYVASAVDRLAATVTGGYADFGPQGSQAYTAASVLWSRRLRPRLDSQLAAGGFFTQQVRLPDSAASSSGDGLPVLPTVDYYLSGSLLQRSALRIQANINAGNRAYFDAVEGGVRPLAGGGVGLDFIHPPDVTVGLAASYYTPSLPPTQNEIDNPSNGRTALSVRVPVTYQLTRNHSLEIGTIFTGRGAHLALIDEAGEAFSQTEFWVYVSFRTFYSS